MGSIQQIKAARNMIGRVTAALAVATTLSLVWIENVKAFVSHPSFSTAMLKLVQTSSCAAWVARFPSVAKISSLDEIRKSSVSIKSALTRATTAGSIFSSKAKSSTRLSMAWSMSDLSSMTSSAFEQSPLRPFRSWYHEVDFRAQPPVYDDTPSNDFSFYSPADSWPSMAVDSDASMYAQEENMEVPTQAVIKRRPIRAIRRVASSAINIIPRPGRSL